MCFESYFNIQCCKYIFEFKLKEMLAWNLQFAQKNKVQKNISHIRSKEK